MGPNARGVADVVMAPDTLTIPSGDTATIQAQAVNAGGTPVIGVSLFWSSGDSTIASVDQNGKVKAVGLGAVSIDASTAGVSPRHPARIVVIAQPAASIVLAPKAMALRIGGAFQFTDTTKDAAGNVVTGRPVLWSSSDTTVAPVDQSGLALAKRLGSATITVSSGSVSAKATVTVSRVPVARIVIAPSNPTVSVGQTTQLSATPLDSAGNVLTGVTITWSSSDPTTATIDQTGSATGMKAGVVTLTVTSGSVAASSSLTVRAAPVGSVATVVVTPDTATITNSNNSSVQLTATLLDANGITVVGPPIVWSSDNTDVAVVSPTGVVMAAKHHSQGTATITATAEGIQGTATVTVVVGPGGH
jgi:uncharacterized protein YjdB